MLILALAILSCADDNAVLLFNPEDSDWLSEWSCDDGVRAFQGLAFEVLLDGNYSIRAFGDENVMDSGVVAHPVSSSELEFDEGNIAGRYRFSCTPSLQISQKLWGHTSDSVEFFTISAENHTNTFNLVELIPEGEFVCYGMASPLISPEDCQGG